MANVEGWRCENRHIPHVAQDQDGCFIRWKMENGKWFNMDEDFAKLFDLTLSEYRYILRSEYNGIADEKDSEISFIKEEHCQKAIDEFIQPQLLIVFINQINS